MNIDKLNIPCFRSIFVTMRVEWRSSTPCFVLLLEQRKVNSSFSRVRSNPQLSRLHSASEPLRYEDGLKYIINTHRFNSKNIIFKSTKINRTLYNFEVLYTGCRFNHIMQLLFGFHSHNINNVKSSSAIQWY